MTAHHDTPYGRLEVHRERDAADPDRITVEVLVPANTTASLGLPDAALVTEVVRGDRRTTMVPDTFGSGCTRVTFRRRRDGGR